MKIKLQRTAAAQERQISLILHCHLMFQRMTMESVYVHLLCPSPPILKEAPRYQIGYFFTHCVRGGEVEPIVKNYVADLYSSEGLLTT